MQVSRVRATLPLELYSTRTSECIVMINAADVATSRNNVAGQRCKVASVTSPRGRTERVDRAYGIVLSINTVSACGDKNR
jgi:hypothetical protein